MKFDLNFILGGAKNEFLFLVHFDGNSSKWLTGFFLEA